MFAANPGCKSLCNIPLSKIKLGISGEESEPSWEIPNIKQFETGGHTKVHHIRPINYPNTRYNVFCYFYTARKAVANRILHFHTDQIFLESFQG